MELSYPLSDQRAAVRTASGATVSSITLERVLAGEVAPGDVRVAPATLRLQAEFAERGGNLQLAENLRRGAELTAFDDDELLAFYEALRPGRATEAEMGALADRLAAGGAERCAALVREACAAYARRGLLPR
jgi:propanediol dehydratase small subunit